MRYDIVTIACPCCGTMANFYPSTHKNGIRKCETCNSKINIILRTSEPEGIKQQDYAIIVEYNTREENEN